MWAGQRQRGQVGRPRLSCSGAARDPGGERYPGARRARGATRRFLDVLVATALALTLAVAGAASASAEPHSQPNPRHHRQPAPASEGTTTTVPESPTTTSAASLPQPAPPPTAPPDTCAKGNWVQAVQGAPPTYTAGTDAAYLWYDKDGSWALRFTHTGPGDKTIFAGSIRAASGQFLDVSSYSGHGRDIVAPSANKHTIYFRFVDFGSVDGLNFATHCTKAFTVNIHAGGPLVSANQVYLGSSSVNPPGDPFKVGRGSLLSATKQAPIQRD